MNNISTYINLQQRFKPYSSNSDGKKYSIILSMSVFVVADGGEVQ